MQLCSCQFSAADGTSTLDSTSKAKALSSVHLIVGKNHVKTHCSYLNIYISQTIRLCKGDFEGKFQFNLQAKSITFLGWKFRSIILIFLLFFAEFVKSTAFYTLLLLFQRVDMFELRFDAKIAIQICQLFGIAATACKKQWI